MELSEFQKRVWDQVIDEEADELSVELSDSELNIFLEAGGHSTPFTANEGRKLAKGILQVYHQRGWGRNIVPTADYIFDLANVADDKISAEDIEQKWNHDGEIGGGQQYTIVADTGNEPIMSFNSKIEAMEFCEDWNSRSSWVIEYHLEKDGERVAIWDLTESEGEIVAERLEEEITRLISSENVPDWDISVIFQPEVPWKEGTERIFRVGIRRSNTGKGRYRYQIYYSLDDNEGGGINTITQQSMTEKRRVRIDRQRGRILEAMSKVPKRLGIYIGPADANLEWLNLGSGLTPDHDFP